MAAVLEIKIDKINFLEPSLIFYEIGFFHVITDIIIYLLYKMILI